MARPASRGAPPTAADAPVGPVHGIRTGVGGWVYAPWRDNFYPEGLPQRSELEHADPLVVTALELGAGAIALTLLAPVMPLLFPAFAGPLFVLPGAADAGYLLLLAFACTLFPFALSLVALRHMSAFSAQLAVNLEPVYAIVLAIVLLSEQQELSLPFYLGVVIILAAVLVHPVLARPRRISHPEALAVGESRDVTD